MQTLDGAVTTTSYSGCDAGDRSRFAQPADVDRCGGKRDGSGRRSGRLNYQTHYFVGVLGNLQQVTQGSQTRVFTYEFAEPFDVGHESGEWHDELQL